MNIVNKLHRKAMAKSDQAFIEKMAGNIGLWKKLISEAYKLEKEAAALLVNDFESEPTRSVLHRSAASLAIDCMELREAERLIATALAGNPPEEIANELRDLFENDKFEKTFLALKKYFAETPDDVLRKDFEHYDSLPEPEKGYEKGR